MNYELCDKSINLCVQMHTQILNLFTTQGWENLCAESLTWTCFEDQRSNLHGFQPQFHHRIKWYTYFTVQHLTRLQHPNCTSHNYPLHKDI